jgi:hypothetical protein
MRAAALLCACLFACGPKVSVQPSPFEEDDPRAGASIDERAPTYAELPEAPVGPGARQGQIARAELDAVLDGSPGLLFRHLEVDAVLDGQTFRGWRIVGFAPDSRLFAGVDLQAEDVVVAVNGRAIARPDQLQQVWDSLRTADALVVDVRRGDAKLQLELAIVGPATPAPAEPPASAAVSPARPAQP